MSPYEELAKNEISLEATGKASLGVASLMAGFKASYNLDANCPTTGGNLKAELGAVYGATRSEIRILSQNEGGSMSTE